MNNQNLSIKDIAQLAQVSVATVSRVLNQNGRYSKETEKRILEIVKKYNYNPNSMAKSLRANRSNVIGIIVPDITNDFFARISVGIQMRLLEHSYAAIICNTHEDAQLEKQHYSMLQNQKVAGIIYISSLGNLQQTWDVPTVFIDRTVFQKDKMPEGRLVCIESDNEQGGFLAAEELIACGCRNIAIVAYGEIVSSHRDRIKGYQNALIAHKMPRNPLWMYPVDTVTTESGYKATMELMQKEPQIDGIFYTADILACGGIRALAEMGISVPEQVKMVGYDDSMICTLVTPSLTTIRQDVASFADHAVTAILQMIEDKQSASADCKLPVTLIRRESTGCQL